MNIMVTKTSGFVGRHVVAALLLRGHSVTVVTRHLDSLEQLAWREQVGIVACDLHKDYSAVLPRLAEVEALIHLAWPGLPNYRNYAHVNENLPADIIFLHEAAQAGLRHLVVAGTCLEYGIQYGPLDESMPTFPTTPYGFSKDALRKSLQLLQGKHPFILQWIRLFYMYGEGQNPNSLLAQLDRSIANKDPVFNMSPGDQLRDYMPVEQVAETFADALEHPTVQGVINCCSGEPISVREMVEQRCRELGSGIELNRGHYPYPDYESLAFWGVPGKLRLLRQRADEH